MFADPVAAGAVNAGLVLALSSALLAGDAAQGRWMAPPHGAQGAIDFAAFWASARATLAGRAAQAYDWGALQPILEAAGGGPVSGRVPVYYPPAYLLVTAPLGLLPYAWGFAAWVAAGLAAFAATLRLASRRVAVGVIALAGVGVFASVQVGQNGLFTASALAAGLALSGRRPRAAGMLLGLLACKPQLALVVPVVLAAGGRWRALAAAAATALALALAAGALLGWDAYPAFLAAAARAQARFAGRGWLPWGKVQTVYGDLRQAGVGARAAMAGAGAAALAAAAVAAWLWRSGARLRLKVAGALAAAFLMTPYAFTYDAATLAMAMAFLLGDVEAARPLGPAQAAVLAAAFLAPFMANPWPTTAPAAAALLAVAAWRAGAGRRITDISPPASHPHATVKASS